MDKKDSYIYDRDDFEQIREIFKKSDNILEASLNDYITNKKDLFLNEELDIAAELDRIEKKLDSDEELDDRDVKIIIISHKLAENEPLSAEEVALMLGITKQYVNRIEKKAKDKIKKRILAEPDKYSALKEDTFEEIKKQKKFKVGDFVRVIGQEAKYGDLQVAEVYDDAVFVFNKYGEEFEFHPKDLIKI